MNTTNNNRYKETEEKIQKAYGYLIKNKSAAQISVSDICKKANIHRTTFYGHYQDIIELQEAVELQQLLSFKDAFEQNGAWNLRDGFLAQLEFYQTHKDIIKRHLNSITANNDILFTFIKDEPKFKESYKENFNCSNNTEYQYHHAFINAGYTSIVKKWLLDDCKESPEEIADIMCNMINHLSSGKITF